MTLKIVEIIICSLYFISIVLGILKIAHSINISWLLISAPAIIGTIIVITIIGIFIHMMRNMI